MRAPNGAKMDLASALFLRVKIMRIHCKKQGLGGVPSSFVMHQNQVFFCKKNWFFTTQRFASTGSSLFRFKDLFFHNFRGVFGVFVFGTRFWDKTWTCSVLVAKNRVFCWLHVLRYVEKTWFFSKKRAQNWTVKESTFLGPFLEIVTTPTQELDSGRVFTRKK